MLKKIDELVDELNPQGEALQAVLFLKAQSLRKADKEASRMALEDALNQAPDTELARQIRRILETEFDDGKQDAAPGYVE